MSRGLSPVSTGGTCSGDSQKDLKGTLMCELMGDILGDSHFHMGELIVGGCEALLGSKHWGSVLQDQFEAISSEI